jgi:multidrug efflux pump subunit AcrB
MRVRVNADRMASYGLTPTYIIGALNGQNIQAAAGRVGSAPTHPDRQLEISIGSKVRGVVPNGNGHKITYDTTVKFHVRIAPPWGR